MRSDLERSAAAGRQACVGFTEVLMIESAPTKIFQKLVLRTPLVIIPTLIGEIEQDYLYWPLKYRAIAENWRKNTEWGALFQQYQQKGFLQPENR